MRTDGLRNLFTYIVPKMGTLTSADEVAPATSVEEDSTDENLTDGDDGQEDDEIIPEEFSMRELQIERWVRLLKWIGNMSIEALRNEASAAEIRAANEELALIADAQTKTFDYTYAHTLNMSGWGSTISFWVTRGSSALSSISMMATWEVNATAAYRNQLQYDAALITFTETSGAATGNTDKLILFDVSENTTGSPRHATMTITSGRDKLTLEVAQSATPASN